MANLGFVGLGVMGGQMVKRLLEKGHSVTGYNRTRAKAQWLMDAGMRIGISTSTNMSGLRTYPGLSISSRTLRVRVAGSNRGLPKPPNEKSPVFMSGVGAVL